MKIIFGRLRDILHYPSVVAGVAIVLAAVSAAAVLGVWIENGGEAAAATIWTVQFLLRPD